MNLFRLKRAFFAGGIPRSRQSKDQRFGFTLIELLVVIAIIAVLMSILLPAVQQAREAARRTQCKNNLMQIGLALSNYMMAHNVLPPGTENNVGPIQSKEGAGYHMGWMAQILPYVDQQNAFEKIDFNQSVYDTANVPVRNYLIRLFHCYSDPNVGGKVTNYCGIHNDFEAPIDVDQNGVLFLNSSIRYDQIRDGSSNTVFITETRFDNSSNLGWMAGTRSSLRSLVKKVPKPNSGQPPANVSPVTSDREYVMHYDGRLVGTSTAPAKTAVEVEASGEYVGGPGSYHAGGWHMSLGDGSVRFVSLSIDPATLRNLAHRTDGELLGDF